ncbi:DUF4184 family protein [Clostridium botulinum]|uniref:Membrane protein n=3 Tax=Clostridium botulinum TaxID=1491 RepID=A0A9Q1UXV6_CLOBO|nr:DUF4184 family protein [Clostridium botulinum]AEB76555.1 conserved hypothetical protein [Clostridium botulinum BKT015925]KEH97420.1 membrane protein [Clostridium botulinum D str. 16868]KEI04062.1 membrane protein [Clostridium botulinum C/D str. Sp77]KLU76064.1 membrane protein [Clostridium botulinum V891]KOA74238.1 membrane protein [Clostridium botulinum]
MPFTFSHPAIVIPLNKQLPKYFNITALILGSMAPDFEYFLRFKPIGKIGHTLLGVFSFDIPIVFIMAFLWHCIIKKTFILSLPDPFDKKLSYFLNKKADVFNIKYVITFVVSTLVGVYSHILWDAFTHKTGFFVTRIALLSNNIKIMHFNIPIYKILQHGSTLIATVYIIIYVFSIMKYNCNKINYFGRSTKISYWGFIIFMTLLITTYRILFTLNFFSLKYFGVYIVSFISAGILSLLIVSAIFNINLEI